MCLLFTFFKPLGGGWTMNIKQTHKISSCCCMEPPLARWKEEYHWLAIAINFNGQLCILSLCMAGCFTFIIWLQNWLSSSLVSCWMANLNYQPGDIYSASHLVAMNLYILMVWKHKMNILCVMSLYPWNLHGALKYRRVMPPCIWILQIYFYGICQNFLLNESIRAYLLRKCWLGFCISFPSSSQSCYC